MKSLPPDVVMVMFATLREVPCPFEHDPTRTVCIRFRAWPVAAGHESLSDANNLRNAQIEYETRLAHCHIIVRLPHDVARKLRLLQDIRAGKRVRLWSNPKLPRDLPYGPHGVYRHV